MHKWGKIGPAHLLSENDDLSILLFFSKQCLVENIQGKFQNNSSATLISLRNHLKHQKLSQGILVGSLRNHDGNGNGNATEQKNYLNEQNNGCARAL